MTIDDLRKALEGVDGTLDIVEEGWDHSYDKVSRIPGVVPAEVVEGVGYFQYYDDASMFPDGTKTKVFLIT